MIPDPPPASSARRVDLRELVREIRATAFEVERDLDANDEPTARARARRLRELLERLPR